MASTPYDLNPAVITIRTKGNCFTITKQCLLVDRKYYYPSVTMFPNLLFPFSFYSSVRIWRCFQKAIYLFMWQFESFIGKSGTKEVYHVVLIVTTVHCHDGSVYIEYFTAILV